MQYDNEIEIGKYIDDNGDEAYLLNFITKDGVPHSYRLREENIIEWKQDENGNWIYPMRGEG